MSDTEQNTDSESLQRIIEAALLAAGEPLGLTALGALFSDEERPSAGELGAALSALAADCEGRAIEMVEVASGFRLQIRQNLTLWVSRLWTEKPQRYSRAMLETLSLIAYRQPITRGEIEEVRGVSVHTNIIRTLQERDWIRVIGHRDVPGKPALFGTTRAFLDYFNLASLDDLPTLAEIHDMANPEPELDLEPVVQPEIEPEVQPEIEHEVQPEIEPEVEPEIETGDDAAIEPIVED